MKERPTSVTVFSIINLVLCGLGIIGTIFWVLGLMGIRLGSAEGNPVMQMMDNSTAYQLFTNIMSGLGVLVTILVISASIGMLSLKPWARSVTIGWGVYSILMMIAAAAVNYLAIFGPLIANSSGPERVGMIVGFVIQIVIFAFFMGYYLLMIFMLTRPKVVDAFTPGDLDGGQGRWDAHPSETEGVGGANL